MARGIGIIALAVAILPMLGIGGMCFTAESAGPSKDRNRRLLNRYRKSTIRYLFAPHNRLRIVLLAVGMPAFDALCHAFSTVAIGGFSTHDAS